LPFLENNQVVFQNPLTGDKPEWPALENLIQSI